MKTTLEKAIIMLAIGTFVVTSISIGALGGSITKEEAIEISKNSGLVKEGMSTYDHSQVEAMYYNSSLVEQMKKGHAGDIYEKVPEEHSIWKVTWAFNPGGLMIGYTVIVIVDAETGTIVYDTEGVGFG